MNREKADILFSLFLFGIAIYDLLTMKILDIVLLCGAVFVLIVNLKFSGIKETIKRGLIALGVGFSITVLLTIGLKVTGAVWMGGGDIKLITLIVFYLNRKDILKYLILTVLSLILLIASLYLLESNALIPFGPFLCGIFIIITYKEKLTELLIKKVRKE